MPFTTLAKITNFIPKAINTALANEAVFTDVEKAASLIVANITGIEIPVDVADSPDWIHLPIAYIIKKITATTVISTKSEEMLKEVADDYDLAISILESPTHGSLDKHNIVFAATGATEGGVI